MDLALIPPVSRLLDINNRPMHLLLPQLFEEYKSYETYYMYMPKGKTKWSIDKYYILDNGAAEGAYYSFDELIEIGRQYRVDEIVLPDVMGDALRTYKNLMRMPVYSAHPGTFKYMYVAHGHSMFEVIDYVDKVVDKFPQVTCIGLPRILFDTISDSDGLGINLRIKLARIIKARALDIATDIDIHLLGAHPLWYWEAQQAASVPEIRSMDTSLPYVLASYGFHLTDKDQGKHPYGLQRPSNYFERVLTPEEESLSHWNTQTMDRWVSRGRSETTPTG